MVVGSECQQCAARLQTAPDRRQRNCRRRPITDDVLKQVVPKPDLGIRKLLVVSNGEVSVDSIQFVGLGTTHSERLVGLSLDVREIVLAGDWFDHCAQHQKAGIAVFPLRPGTKSTGSRRTRVLCA